MTTYTLRPTADNPELTSLRDEDYVVEVVNEREVIDECRKSGWSGVHVFSGSHGPVYGEEGREENYHGWIDAREEP